MSFSEQPVYISRAYARLHMGFFDMHGGLGRKFGSIGLALSAPVTEIHAKRADTNQVVGMPHPRALKLLEEMTAHFGLRTGLAISVQQSIPEHAGLGSGTQLALSVASLINTLYGLGLDDHALAEISTRGARSGVGIGAFTQGGLIVDGGRAVSGGIPPVISRMAFPEAWRVILICDNAQQGVHGASEVSAFQNLPMFSEALAGKLCRYVLMQALPALAEQNLQEFGRAIVSLQTEIGDYFAPVQGGRYASPAVAKVLEWFSCQGIACLGQSSWGPTGFAIVASAAEAEALCARMTAEFMTLPTVSFMVCAGRNIGSELIRAES